MIVWGGYDGVNVVSSGARYIPGASSWTATPASGAPAPRFAQSGVWTGTELLVWGGESTAPNTTASFFTDGGRYNPTANQWAAITSQGAPAGRAAHTANWTGNEMLVWGGGSGAGNFNDTSGYTAPRLVYLYQRP